MAEVQKDPKEISDQIYAHALNLISNEKMSAYETKKLLISEGMDEPSAAQIVDRIEKDLKINEPVIEEKKNSPQLDMLYGGLWCLGGTIATVADFGYVFWGAIVFGAIQFFKGLVNSFVRV